MLVPKEWKDWADDVAYYWRDLGASSEAAPKFALLWGFASAYGYNPRITSVWRDPEKQKRMQERWDAGDRSGLRARPATNSKHTQTNWLGRPASTAMDMPCSDDVACARLARELGLGAGQYFKRADPGHYYLTG